MPTPSSDTVTVICRMPSGLRLDLYDTDLLKERALSAAPVIAPPVPVRSVMLNGARHDSRFHTASPNLSGLAGRTVVDTAFWNAWIQQNPNFPPLKSGLIFAQKNPAHAEKSLLERADERTGFEGLDPHRLPGVHAASEQAA